MKNMNMLTSFRPCVLIILLITFFGGLAGCRRGDARLSGHLVGAAGQKVLLERVMLGEGEGVDTIATNDKGEFDFPVTLPDRQPTIFNLRYENDIVPLLISPRERVTVMSLGDLDGYRVSGSPESELVWRLHGIMTGGAKSLDSIYTLHSLSPADGDRREELRRKYLDRYLKVKRSQIGFIVEHSSSLAAVYALYQRLPGDEVLFNGDSDVVYYRMVADSVRGRYPDSRYVKSLEREIDRRTRQQEFLNRIDTTTVSEVNHPEIDLPDMYGARVKLSSLAGRVIVLDFWSASSAASSVNNAEMKELWRDFSDRGMAVYQVSLDTDKALWVNAVQEQKLPWVTVCDFRGPSSHVVGLYNLQSLPANFVIDRGGNIAARNLYGNKLRQKVESLL